MNCSDDFCLDDLNRLSIEAVMASPKVGKLDCKRLQSFAYLKDWTNVKEENFGNQILSSKDFERVFIRKPDTQFPALIISPDSMKINDQFQNVTHDVDKYEILVIDEHRPDCTNCGKCGNRTIQEIRDDCKRLWKQWADYIRNVSMIAVNGEDDGFWQNKNRVEALVSDGQLDSYKENYVVSKNRLTKWRKDNTEITGNYIQFGRVYIGFHGVITLRCVETEKSYPMDYLAKYPNKAGRK